MYYSHRQGIANEEFEGSPVGNVNLGIENVRFFYFENILKFFILTMQRTILLLLLAKRSFNGYFSANQRFYF